MTCKDFEDSVTEYLEEALAPATRADFEGHLATCTDCRSYLDQMRVLIAASHRLGDKLNEEWHARVPDTPEQYFEKLHVRALGKSRAEQVRGRKLVPAIVALAAIAIAAAVWFGVLPAIRSAPSTPQNLTIDLSHWMRLRGTEQPSLQPVNLKRARLNLTILLPVGTLPGKFDVAIWKDQKVLAQVATNAEFVNHLTTLHVQLDCRRFQKGTYTLAIRKDNWNWEEYPALVR
jgi:hypothetical protein